MFWHAMEYPSLIIERTSESQRVVDNRGGGREGTSGMRLDVKRRGSPVGGQGNEMTVPIAVRPPHENGRE